MIRKSKEEIANNRSTDKIFLPSVCEELRLSRIKGWNKAVRYSHGWAKQRFRKIILKNRCRKSIQEIFNDDSFRFFLAHTERAKLHKLFIIDSADCRFMNDLRIYMFCIDLRNRAYLCLIHNNRITLRTCMTPVIADRSRMKDLF